MATAFRFALSCSSRGRASRHSGQARPPRDENAMWSRYSRLCEIALVLLLILMASGDDFQLGRLMLPFSFSTCPADILPLDDPNTDFTKSDGSQLPRQTRMFGFRDMAFSHWRPWIGLPLSLCPSGLNDPYSASDNGAHADLLTPLRC